MGKPRIQWYGGKRYVIVLLLSVRRELPVVHISVAWPMKIRIVKNEAGPRWRINRRGAGANSPEPVKEREHFQKTATAQHILQAAARRKNWQRKPGAKMFPGFSFGNGPHGSQAAGRQGPFVRTERQYGWLGRHLRLERSAPKRERDIRLVRKADSEVD